MGASTKQGSVPNIVASATSVLPTPVIHQNAGAGENQTSAADLVASILNGTDLSKKHIRKSSSNSKITTGPAVVGPLSSSSGNENQICKQDQTRTNTNGKVRTIEIKREAESGSSTKDLHRSNSGSSDTSSGFGSLNNSDHPTQATPSGSTVPQATADNSSSSSSSVSTSGSVIKSKLDLGSNPVTKLQLLQERRNKLSTEHHPSSANHFGFAGRYRPDHHGPLLLNFNNSRNNPNQNTNTHARAAR